MHKNINQSNLCIFVCLLNAMSDKKNVKIRSYQEEYLNYGFYFKLVEGKQIPICLLCNLKPLGDKFRSNSSLRLCVLKDHFNSQHKKEYPDADTDTFRRLIPRDLLQPEEGAGQKNYVLSKKISFLIAKKGYAYNLGKGKHFKYQ